MGPLGHTADLIWVLSTALLLNCLR